MTPPSDPYNYTFRFWGGAGDWTYGTDGSAEYTSVWICTNGFLAFDGSNSTSPTPINIPDPQAPNAVIAAVWSDLRLDNASAIYYGWRRNAGPTVGYSGWSFFVTWDFVEHKASQIRLAFQVVLANALGYWGNPYIVWGQSQFRISYQTASSINTDFAFGIEDQEGYKGLGDLFLGSQLDSFDSKTYWFQQTPASSNYFLSKLKLTFNDTCVEKTRFWISGRPDDLRGYNVALKEPKTPDIDERFKAALSGERVLLEKFGGVIFKVFFIGLEMLPLFSPNLYSTIDYLELRDQLGDNPILYGAYIVASVPPGYQRPYGSAVDATIGVIVHWILDDANNMGHSLTITAKLEYYEVTWDGNVVETPHNITTSVNLKVTTDSPDKINNDSFENATEVQEGTYSWLYADQTDDVFDFYKLYVDYEKIIRVKIDVDSDDNFNLYLYNSSGYEVDRSENGIGQSEFVHGEQLEYPGGWWYIEVNATWEYGFYNMTIGFNTQPNTPSTPSGPTSGITGTYYTYSTSTTDPDGDNVYYLFDWGDGATTTKGPYSSGATVWAAHSWGSVGTYYVKVKAKDSYGAWSSWSSSRQVSISGGSGGGGDGCPTLFVWNGTSYVDYGVIDIHNPTGEDVTQEMPVSSEDVGVSNHKVLFKLREGWEGLNFSESVIDQIQLYAVDDEGNRHLCPLISAEHSTLGNVLPKLLASDDHKVQTLLLETIDLKFIAPPQNIQSFTFIIEGCNQLKN